MTVPWLRVRVDVWDEMTVESSELSSLTDATCLLKTDTSLPWLLLLLSSSWQLTVDWVSFPISVLPTNSCGSGNASEFVPVMSEGGCMNRKLKILYHLTETLSGLKSAKLTWAQPWNKTQYTKLLVLPITFQALQFHKNKRTCKLKHTLHIPKYKKRIPSAQT